MRVLYTSVSPSTAVLEFARAHFGGSFVPETFLVEVRRTTRAARGGYSPELPQDSAALASVVEIGQALLADGKSLAIKVQLVVCSADLSVILNPLCEKSCLQVTRQEAFVPDARLVR